MILLAVPCKVLDKGIEDVTPTKISPSLSSEASEMVPSLETINLLLNRDTEEFVPPFAIGRTLDVSATKSMSPATTFLLTSNLRGLDGVKDDRLRFVFISAVLAVNDVVLMSSDVNSRILPS
jgi:hypothetical protein